MSIPSRDFTGRLGDLARAHQAALEAFALKLCGDRDDARDLTQDTFERALRADPSQQPHTNERAWLFTMLHHLFVDRHRSKKRAPVRVSVDALELPAAVELPPSPWASVTVEQVQAAVAHLDEEFRVAYRMHVLDRRSYQEIAAALNVPVSTVGTRILRARRKLRAILEPHTAGERDE